VYIEAPGALSVVASPNRASGHALRVAVGASTIAASRHVWLRWNIGTGSTFDREALSYDVLVESSSFAFAQLGGIWFNGGGSLIPAIAVTGQGDLLNFGPGGIDANAVKSNGAWHHVDFRYGKSGTATPLAVAIDGVAALSATIDLVAHPFSDLRVGGYDTSGERSTLVAYFTNVLVQRQ
jgi:hypothetical protein